MRSSYTLPLALPGHVFPRIGPRLVTGYIHRYQPRQTHIPAENRYRVLYKTGPLPTGGFSSHKQTPHLQSIPHTYTYLNFSHGTPTIYSDQEPLFWIPGRLSRRLNYSICRMDSFAPRRNRSTSCLVEIHLYALTVSPLPSLPICAWEKLESLSSGTSRRCVRSPLIDRILPSNCGDVVMFRFPS